MKSYPTLFAAPFVAALVGWMISGSPVPMVFSLGLFALSSLTHLSTRRFQQDPQRQVRCILPVLFAGGLTAWEIQLFQTGDALALRAELPLVFHLAMGALWWVSSDSLVHQSGHPRDHGSAGRDLTGIVAGFLLLYASASTVLYDFGPWIVFPLASFPLATFSTAALLPRWAVEKRILFATLPATMLITGTILSTGILAARASNWLDKQDTDSTELSDTPSSRTSSGNGPLDGAAHQLPRNSDVAFTHQIQVSIRAYSSRLFHSWRNSPLYLRTSTLAVFESDEILSPIRSGRWLYDIDDGNEDNSISLQHPAGTNNEVYSLYIPRAAVGHLPLLSDTEIFFGSAVYEFADDWFQLSPAQEIQNLRYTATTSLSVFPAADHLPDIQTLRGQEIPKIYLNLPPSPLVGRLRSLTAQFDRHDPLRAIQDFLAQQARYSLHFSTPDDSSPIEDFLFGTGQGHCEHYASATVMMLRTLGVPSRVAYGYAGGSADPIQKLISFRDSDFHAWAEILTPPDNQWVIFDTTPQVSGAAPGTPAIGSLPFVDELNYKDFSEFAPGAFRSRGRFSEIFAEWIAFLSRHFLLFTGVGLSLLGVIWFQVTRRQGLDRKPELATNRFSPVSSIPDFLQELEKLVTSSGIAKLPGHTWREVLQRLNNGGGVPDFVRVAVDYHYSVRYGMKPKNENLESDLLRQIQQWKSGTPGN